MQGNSVDKGHRAPQRACSVNKATEFSSGTMERGTSIGLLLAPGFSIDEFALFLGALELAGNMGLLPGYQTTILSEKGGNVIGSLRSQVGTDPLDIDNSDFDYFFVFCDIDASFENTNALRSCFSRLRRKTCILGAIGAAVPALTRLKLINQKTPAIHKRHQRLVREYAPQQLTSEKLCELEGRVWTSCGRTAALDMALSLVARSGGESAAMILAREFLHSRTHRRYADADGTLMSVSVTGSPTVNRALELFEKNVETPFLISQVAEKVGTSVRQLERAFKTYCGVSPARKYLEIRLSHARDLVWHTEFSIMNIALSAGFSNAATMSRCYRKQFRTTPSADRKRKRFAAANLSGHGN